MEPKKFNSLVDFLTDENFQARPAMYAGRAEFPEFGAWLRGLEMGWRHGDWKKPFDLDGFHEWLLSRYGGRRNTNWVDVIQRQFGDGRETTERFFELLNDFLVQNGENYLNWLLRYEGLVAQLRTGYDMCIYEYTDDISCRQHLEDSRTNPTVAEFWPRVQAADEQLRANCLPTLRCIHGEYPPSHFWYWMYPPDSPELELDLKEMNAIQRQAAVNSKDPEWALQQFVQHSLVARTKVEFKSLVDFLTNEHFQARPAMYAGHGQFPQFGDWLRGLEFGWRQGDWQKHNSELDGFREWLHVRFDSPGNIDWIGAIHWKFGDGRDTTDKLFELLNEFLEYRTKVGINSIIQAHAKYERDRYGDLVSSRLRET